MTSNPLIHPAHALTVATPVFEGPLDLLLQLIERAELDITRLALAQVTDQYLAHLKQIQQQAPDEVSAFLVIAARLLQIKSEALLPRPPEREAGEEDPGEALARQLMNYRRFRRIADWLGERETAGLRTYLRLAPPPKVDAALDLTGMGLPELVAAAQLVFTQLLNQQSLESVVSAPRITIREKITYITQILGAKKSTTFRALLTSRHSRLEIVVTFLALLELVKRRLVIARQENLFGEIALETSEIWGEPGEFELEFGE